MRKFALAFLVAAIALSGRAFASPAAPAPPASQVRQLLYAYPYSFGISLAGPAFVICEQRHCPPRKALALAPAPKPILPMIVIRVSQPVHAPEAPVPEASHAPKPMKPAPAGLISSNPVPVHPPACEGGEAPEALKPMVVHFAFDSYRLRPLAKAKLKAAFSRLDRLTGPVVITGYTDDIGTRAYNRRLSRERADAVALYLQELGVIPIAVIGRGKCCFVSKIQNLNRRVEVREVSRN